MIDTIEGPALTDHARFFYELERADGEADDSLRARCLSQWPPGVVRTPLPASDEDRARFAESIRAIGSSAVVRCEPSEADRLLLAMVATDPIAPTGDGWRECHYCLSALDDGKPHADDCAWDRARAYLTAGDLLKAPESTLTQKFTAPPAMKERIEAQIAADPGYGPGYIAKTTEERDAMEAARKVTP